MSISKNHKGTGQPWMVYTLIGINVLVHALHTLNRKELGLQPQFAPSLASVTLENSVLVPGNLYQAPAENWKRIVTSMFSHANLAHLIFNMAALYEFGRPLEHKIGAAHLLLIYMLAGLGTNLVYTLFNRKSSVGIVGASAAISGVSAAYFLEYADRKNMRTWLTFQLFGAFMTATSVGPGVSFVSHLIGFAIGAMVYLFIRQ